MQLSLGATGKSLGLFVSITLVLIFVSCRAISRDPVAFTDPEKFDPRRWIDDNGQFRKDMSGSFAYGFGRRFVHQEIHHLVPVFVPDDVVHRACPGQHLANNSLYINIALLFWSFRITEITDKPIDMYAYTDTVVSHPAPFEVNFVPRVDEGLMQKKMWRET